MIDVSIRDEALLMLHGRGTILEVAREITQVLSAHNIDGGVIGGIAVVLHGHLRTTGDVDVYSAGPIDQIAAALKATAFVFDADKKEFTKNGIPVHLVSVDQIPEPPKQWVEIDGIRTVGLADLINMKLRTGTRNVLRSQDLADVIGLIRIKGLGRSFASQIDKSLRAEFRKLVEAIEAEG